MMLDRSDGLLRGPREEREKQMLSLRTAEWDVDTLLALQLGFLDHAEDVRLAALDALMEIAGRNPASVPVSPLDLLICHLSAFTVASGATHQIFRFLVQLDTPESEQAVRAALRRSIDGRVEDFTKFLSTLIQAGKLEHLQWLESQNLPKRKQAALHKALEECEGRGE